MRACSVTLDGSISKQIALKFVSHQSRVVLADLVIDNIQTSCRRSRNVVAIIIASQRGTQRRASAVSPIFEIIFQSCTECLG